MRFNRLFIGIILINVILVTTVFGQVMKGLKEVNLAGSFNVSSAGGESFTLIQFATSLAYFINKNVSVGGNLTLVKPEGFDATGAFSALVSVHFAKTEDAKSVPYIGAQIGHGYGSSFDNPFIFGGFVGIKLFVAGGGGAVSIQPFYTRQDFEFGGVNNYGLLTGVSIFFQ